MAHLEARLESDLTQIRNEIANQAKQVQYAVDRAIHALQTGDRKLAYTTVLNDNPINRKMREIDRLCHRFIALHLPSAGHLRLISSSIRTNIALERIGDYAVTLCREAVRLTTPPSGPMLDTVELISGESKMILEQACNAFNGGDAQAAKTIMQQAAKLEQGLEPIYKRMLEAPASNSVRDQLALFIILNQLKRVADQAKNICEDTVFAVTGDTKSPKVYNILFLDETNSLLGKMAQAIGKMNYPHSANYKSAGKTPAKSVSQGLIDFLKSRGATCEDAKTHAISDITFDELVTEHVIVSLDKPVTAYLNEIPFHTSVLEWEIGPVPADDDLVAIETLYRELAVKISDLLILLRGQGAS
jgi:phosphate transport system protein